MEADFPGLFRSTATIVFAAATVLLGGSPYAVAQQSATRPTKTDPVLVARLVRELGEEDYHVRVRADDQLVKLGARARDELQTAAKDDNPELRLRAKELLRRIEIEDLWQASQVRFQTTGKKASEVVAALASQTGNHVLQGDQYGQFSDEPLETEFTTTDFWPTLDELCRRTNNRLRPHFDPREPGLVISSGKAGAYPTAYSGPVRAQIISARRAFSEDYDFETGKSDKTHTFQMTVQMSWESRFRLIAYRAQAELVSGQTNVGTPIAATQPSGAGWNVAGGGARQLSMTLRFQPPPTAATKLDTLSLKWGLIAVGDMAELEVADLTAKSPHYQDDVELRIESVDETPGARCEVSLVVLRDLVLDDPEEAFFQECDVELFDQEGVAFRKQGQTNSTEGDGARIKLTFVGEGTESKAARLKFVYPRIRSQRDVVVTFRDVPLPCGRPE